MLPAMQGAREASLFPIAEVDFRSASVAQIRRHVLNDGYCVLRNAIPMETLSRYGEMIENFYREIVADMEKGVAFEGVDHIHILDDRFTARYGEENSFFNLLHLPKFKQLLDTIFGEDTYFRSVQDTYTRSVNSNSETKDPTSFNPLSIHMDGIYHNYPRRFSVNFWVPFSACGKDTHTPGFAVYPVGYTDIRNCLAFPTWASLQAERHFMFEPEAFEASPISMATMLPKLQELFRTQRVELITPQFALGDIMMINSWTAHGTYCAPDMNTHRRNLEIRYHGYDWDPAPAPSPAS